MKNLIYILLILPFILGTSSCQPVVAEDQKPEESWVIHVTPTPTPTEVPAEKSRIDMPTMTLVNNLSLLCSIGAESGEQVVDRQCLKSALECVVEIKGAIEIKALLECTDKFFIKP